MTPPEVLDELERLGYSSSGPDRTRYLDLLHEHAMSLVAESRNYAKLLADMNVLASKWEQEAKEIDTRSREGGGQTRVCADQLRRLGAQP